MKVVLVSLLVVIGIAGLIERASRFTMDPEVFQTDRVSVRYQWNGSEPWDLGDPVNIGAQTKWLGLRHYGADIAIPSYQIHSRGRYDISRKSIEKVAPVVNTVYQCRNDFWTISCTGTFWYRVDSSEVLFEAGGHYVRPPENWLTDRRIATLTVYKYF